MGDRVHDFASPGRRPSSSPKKETNTLKIALKKIIKEQISTIEKKDIEIE